MATPIPLTVAHFVTSLATRISDTATSFTLASTMTDDGTTLANGIYGFTLDEGTGTHEYIIGSTVGSAVTIITRGLSVIDGQTSIPGQQWPHRRGSEVKITDHPAIIRMIRMMNGVDPFNAPDLTGINSISGLALPVSSELTKAASVAYVNNAMASGAVNASTGAKGIVQQATTAQSQAPTDAGSTAASLFVLPSDIAKNIQNHQFDAWSDTGTANTLAIAPAPIKTSYTTFQGWIVKANNACTGASTLNVNALGPKNIKKYVSGALVNTVIGDWIIGSLLHLIYDGTQFILMNPTAGNTAVIFGGTGADGALTVVSGVTTIDLGGAQTVVKNYSSISITGTGSIAFSNPNANGTFITLKSQGNVTLTSSAAPMIDASGMGSSVASNAILYFDDSSHFGGNGGTGGIGAPGTPGAAGAAGSAGSILTSLFAYTKNSNTLTRKTIVLAPGSAGGNGAAGGASAGGLAGGTGGAGGKGGGALYIECAGAWNFTTASGISVAGKAGGNGTTGASAADNKGGAGGGAGGSGGSGGMVLVLYNTLTANSGTINTAGGAGGNGGGGGITTALKDGSQKAGSGGGGSGGGGGSFSSSGGAGVAGAAGENNDATGGAPNGTNGNNAASSCAGGSGGSGGGGRGGGSTGFGVASTGGTGGSGGASDNVLVAQNIYF